MNLLSHFRPTEKRGTPTEDIFEAICDLLNTKKTFGSYQRDFGLDTYVYLGSNKEITKQIIHDIKACIEKFERRITILDLQSTSSDNPFFLNFALHCKIEGKDHAFHLSFHHQKNFFKKGSYL